VWLCRRRRGLGIFLFTKASRPSLGPTQPPVQWVLGALPLGVKRPDVKLTTHLHLVSRSKNMWSYTSALPIRLHGVMLSFKGKVQGLYLYILRMSGLQLLRKQETQPLMGNPHRKRPKWNWGGGAGGGVMIDRKGDWVTGREVAWGDCIWCKYPSHNLWPECHLWHLETHFRFSCAPRSLSTSDDRSQHHINKCTLLLNFPDLPN
jgi:hypothetical protein